MLTPSVDCSAQGVVALWFRQKTWVQFSGLRCHFLMPNSYHSEPQAPNMCNGDNVIQAYLRDTVSLVSDKDNKANIAITSHTKFFMCV